MVNCRQIPDIIDDEREQTVASKRLEMRSILNEFILHDEDLI